jgi:hypothetical protein
MNDVYALNQSAIEPGRDAAGRLQRVNGALELQAALLALMLPPGSQRAMRAWELEAGAAPDADALREHIAQLPGPARLPWYETLLARMARQPLAAKKNLLLSTRRLAAARGAVRPIDRLHWLAMRRALGDAPPLASRADPNADVSQWLESDVLAIAECTAFLGRMVPAGDTDSADSPASTSGADWYAAVTATWQQVASSPPWKAASADVMVAALGRLQTLSWMQRPIIARTWIVIALQHSRGARLSDLSADALRLMCGLLDSPVPPELARHFVTVDALP